jgi:L-2,4-diaminobutyrate decarboxylase
VSFLSDAQIVIEALDRYYRESTSREKPVIHQAKIGELIAELGLARHVTAGGLTGEGLAGFVARYLSSTTRLHHPGYLAHQVAVPHQAGALAALIDGFTNNPMAIYEMGPGAASIEYFIINWLLERVGWRPSPLPGQGDGDQAYGGGVLTHGGSLANLTALVAARSRLAPTAWRDGNPGDLALLAPPDCHYSVARAVGILGLGSRAMYPVAVDARGVIVPDRLPAALDRLVRDGKRAVALIANAGSTAVGLYDPLREIGEFCRERGLWLHIDGAHGASALLSETHRAKLQGIELADSLVWDAHKLMRTPNVCTALLVRDRRTLDGAFQQEANYLFHEKEQPGYDFIHRTVECTKAGLGLKLFAVLAALGERGLAGYIDHQFAVTMEAYEYIRHLPDFECAVEPQANILCFRTQGDDGEQLRLRDRLIAEGAFYLSTACFNGKRYLRLVLMHPETAVEDIRRLIGQIRTLLAEDARSGESRSGERNDEG